MEPKEVRSGEYQGEQAKNQELREEMYGTGHLSGLTEEIWY